MSFRYMLILQICINSRSYTSNLCDRIYYDPDDTPNRNDEQLCGDKCMSDQCADWKEAHLRTPQLEHINVCYAIHDLCTHRPHYAIPDLLRLNEYWAECLVDRETEWVP